jgi:class 3 adenylate cyclase
MQAEQDFDDAPPESGDGFTERVSPHEMTGRNRQMWMMQLWKAFNDLAVKGTITLADAITIAESLHVEGEEHYVEEHLQSRKEVTFKQLVVVLDDMSRASGNEYRDVELERIVAEDGGHVEWLGLVDYLRYRCGGAQSLSDHSGNAGHDNSVEYRLALRKTDFTPKQLLILTTVGLLLLLAGSVIVGMLLMWDYTVMQAVRRNLAAIHSGVRILIDTLETKLLEFHALGIISTTELLARWSEFVADRSRVQLAASNEMLSRHLVATTSGTAAALAAIANAATIARVSLANDLRLAGATFSDAAALRFAQVASTVTVTSADSCGSDARLLMLANGSSACIPMSTAVAASEVARAVLDAVDASPLLANGSAFVASNGSMLTAHGGRCVTAFRSPDEEKYCELMAETVASEGGARRFQGEWRGMDNLTYVTGFVLLNGSSYIGFQTPLEDQLARQRQRMVDVVNYLNFEFVRSTEIVIALRDRTSGVITPQATKFRFDSGCYFTCSRFPPSTANVLAAFRTRGNGWSLTPDYRPEPVIGGYSYVGHDLDVAIVFERDVIEVRSISFGVVRDVLKSVNEALDGDLILELIGFADTPRMNSYPAHVPCPPTTDCEIDPKGATNMAGVGTYFRYDCRHCQRVQGTNVDMGQVVNFVCDGNVCPVASPAAVAVIHAKSAETTIGTETRGDDSFHTALSFSKNYSVAVSLLAPFDRSTGRFRTTIAAVAGGAVAMLIVGLVTLIASSNRSFGALEDEWRNYKEQLQAEKVRFGALVQGLIPPAIAERLMSGHRILADHTAIAAFVFTDVCGFSEMTKAWSARHVARYMTYCVTLMEAVAVFCDVSKLRSIGDLVVVVALRDEKHRTEAEFHPARRALQFASVTMLLFSKLYVHRPQTARLFRELFKDKLRDGTALDMPQLRIGVHCGPAISGAFSVGKASHYDFYGPGPVLANRMQQTAMPNRIHVTFMVKELLLKRDPHNKYLFDHSRKTVVRGQGTITSYFVRTVTEHVPFELIRANGIDYARTRFDFARGLRQRQHVVNDAESVVSSISDEEGK